MTVHLEAMHVPGCPNLAGLLDNLRAVTDLPIDVREVTTDAEAAAAGMNGSPTLLVNGHDHLNFFADTAAAHAWIRAHPHIPGQILTQADAQALGAHLFGQLLADNTP